MADVEARVAELEYLIERHQEELIYALEHDRTQIKEDLVQSRGMFAWMTFAGLLLFGTWVYELEGLWLTVAVFVGVPGTMLLAGWIMESESKRIERSWSQFPKPPSYSGQTY